MTDRRPPTSDQFLVAWFEDGPTRMPDRVLDVVADRIDRQRQRRPWRLLGRPSMSSYAKLAAAAAAIVLVAVVGYSILPRSAVGPATPTPTPASLPTASPVAIAPSPTSPQCEDLLPGCAGTLAAGSHRTANFEPAFSYTTPAGWVNTIDVPTLVGLSSALDVPDPILVWSGVVPADIAADCVLKAKAGTGATVDDWVTFLTKAPGLVTSNVHEVNLNGSRAVVLDLKPKAGWTSPCSTDGDTTRLGKTIASTPGDGYGVGGDARVRMYVIGNGAMSVIVTMYSYSGGDAAISAALPTVEPLVTSFTFDCKSLAPGDPCYVASSPSGT